jgi:hypothetical protein
VDERSIRRRWGAQTWAPHLIVFGDARCYRVTVDVTMVKFCN